MLTQGPELRARMAQAVQADGVAPSVFNGEFQRAEAYLRAMTRLQRDNAYAWMALGTVLWFHDRVPESLECYQKSYLLDPTQAFVAARIKQLGGALPTP
jgi:predicted Zn-dependent protease